MTLNFHRDAAGINWDILINDLIADNFHNGRTVTQLRESFENSQVQAYAMVGNRCVGTARALSDGIGNAYVIDVWTQSTYRKQGIGRTLMEMLLEKLSGQHVYLQTDDAVDFYRSLGFAEQPSGMSLVVGEYLGGN